MGTSASSSGPGSGVPLIPPWVPEPEIGPEIAPEEDQNPEIDEPVVPQPASPQIAPPGRFRGARLNLGQFADSGSQDGLRRGLGHYARSGLGGSRNASRRMAATARNAGALYGVLHALGSGAPPQADLGIDPADLAGRPARELVDHIAEALSPSDGTLDAEASRTSISWAMCELMRREPGADLLALTLEQILLTMVLYIGADICSRIELDIGKTIIEKAPDPATAVERVKEMKRYVHLVVANRFRRRPANSGPLTQREASRLATRIIQDTFEVFESYLS